MKQFSGPVIDRDIFPGIPAHYASDVPQFDVVNPRDPLGPRWRFWFELERGGWVWKERQTLKGVMSA